MKDNIDVYEFASRNEFREWLIENHESNNSIWIEFTKGKKGFTATDALEESICFGWIDGVMKSINEIKYRKYFSKRKDVHKWSEKNKGIYEKMMDSKKMTKSGIDVYLPEENKKSNQFSADDKIKELVKALQPTPEVLNLYNDKPISRQKQFAGFYCDAKTDKTRNKRKQKIIDALVNNFTGILY